MMARSDASPRRHHSPSRPSHHSHILPFKRSHSNDKRPHFPDVSHIDDLLAERKFQRRVFSTPSFARSRRKKEELVEAVAPGVSVKTARRYYSIERSIPMEDDNRYPDNIWAYDRTAVRVPKELTIGRRESAQATSSENEVSDELWHPAPSQWSSPYGPDSRKSNLTRKTVDDSVYINANVLVDGKGSFWVISQAPLPNGIHTFFMAIITNTASSKVLSLQPISYADNQHQLSRRPSASSIQSTSTTNSLSQRVGGHFSLHGFKKVMAGGGEKDNKKSVSEMEPKPQGRHVVVVQLAGFEENGVCKADPYLPTVPGSVLTYDPPPAAAGHHPHLKIRLISRTHKPHIGSTHSLCTLTAGEIPALTTSPQTSPTPPRGLRHLPSLSSVASVSSVHLNPTRPSISSGVLQSYEDETIRSFDSMSLRTSPGGQHDDKIDLDSMTIHHFDYHGWPDHGVPAGNDVRCLRKLVEEVGAVQRLHGCEVWVHCSAGVGRSGTFVALSSLLLPVQRHPSFPGHALPLDDFSTSPLAPLVDDLARDPIAVTIDRLREQRSWLCERKEQVELVYKMVLVGEGK